MRYEEIVQLSSLEKKLRAQIKVPGYTKGPVKIVWCDDAVEGLKPWHTRHEDGCLAHHNLLNYVEAQRAVRQREVPPHSSTDWYQQRNSPDMITGGCTCKNGGFYATTMLESFTWWIVGSEYRRTPPLPVICRFAPRPFTLANAFKFGDLKDDQPTRVLADMMLHAGMPQGEQLANLLFNAKRPKI